MEIQLKKYNKTKEIDLLAKDDNFFFPGKGLPVSFWKKNIKNDRNVNLLKVFIDDEFAGILCWGIKTKVSWDEKGSFVDEVDKDIYKEIKDKDNSLENVSWLYSIALFEKFRGKKISHKLIKKYEKESKKDGATWLGLHVLIENNAKFLYLAHGFKKITATDKGFYMIKKLNINKGI